MAMLIVSFLIFITSMLVLVGVQRLRQGPLPTGCTPKGGRCCRVQDCPRRRQAAKREPEQR